MSGPDGMKFGADGRLYCTVYGQGDVTVLDPSDGAVARAHPRPTAPSPPTSPSHRRERTSAVVTEVAKGQVEELPAPCAGLPLYHPKTRA